MREYNRTGKLCSYAQNRTLATSLANKDKERTPESAIPFLRHCPIVSLPLLGAACIVTGLRFVLKMAWSEMLTANSFRKRAGKPVTGPDADAALARREMSERCMTPTMNDCLSSDRRRVWCVQCIARSRVKSAKTHRTARVAMVLDFPNCEA